MALDLIFDRTQADADRWFYLANKIDVKGWNALAQAEQQEWLTQLKGAYNYTDMNRVGKAVQTLGTMFVDLLPYLEEYRNLYGVADDKLFHLPYNEADVTVNPKVNWTRGDAVWSNQATQFINDLIVLRGLLPLYKGAPAVPRDLLGLTIQEANDIEKLLFDIDAEVAATTTKYTGMIRNTATNWAYSGDIFSGEM